MGSTFQKQRPAYARADCDVFSPAMASNREIMQRQHFWSFMRP